MVGPCLTAAALKEAARMAQRGEAAALRGRSGAPSGEPGPGNMRLSASICLYWRTQMTRPLPLNPASAFIAAA